MRRVAAISAFALLLSVPLWAQHGGGHGGGGGGHSGFGGGHASFGGGGHGFAGGRAGFSGSHSSFGVHSYSGPLSSARVHAFNHPGSTGPFLHSGFPHGFQRFGFHNGFRNGCWGYGCWGYGYPWWGYGYYPWQWNSWDDDSSYNDDYYRDLAVANEMNQQSLEQQRMFRQEEADGDQDAYAPRRSRSDQQGTAPAASPPQGVSIIPGTVLVFRDRHQEEVQNYAIVGQTLWTFAPQHTQRIPLSDLDLTATAQANDDRGLTFRIPAAR